MWSLWTFVFKALWSVVTVSRLGHCWSTSYGRVSPSGPAEHVQTLQYSVWAVLRFVALVPCDNWTARHRNSETSLAFPAFQNIYLSMHCKLAVLIQSSVIFPPGCLTPVVIPWPISPTLWPISLRTMRHSLSCRLCFSCQTLPLHFRYCAR